MLWKIYWHILAASVSVYFSLAMTKEGGCGFYRRMRVQWNFSITVFKFFGVKNLSIHQWPLSTETTVLHCCSRPTVGKLARIKTFPKALCHCPKFQQFRTAWIPLTWEVFSSISLKYATWVPSSLRTSLGHSPFIISSRAICTYSQRIQNKTAKYTGSQIVHIWPVRTTNLGLCCIEVNGLRGNPSPQQSEGRQVASTLSNLRNSDPGARTKHFRFQRLEISCKEKINILY